MNVDDELRDFRLKWWRTIRWMYVAMMLCYAGAIYAFYRTSEWGNIIQTATIGIIVTALLWLIRGVARIRGDW